MKLFISQPMKGKTNEEILATRKKAIELAKERLGTDDVEVIDSFFKDAPADTRPLWFLGKSFELLSTADVAYFANGWENARGCRMEHEAALAYGVEIIFEQKAVVTMNPTENMDIDKLIRQMKKEILSYTNHHLPLGAARVDGVYIVFQSKALQNYTATMGTHAHDGRYFFCRYDGNGKRAYLSAHKKICNEAVKIPFTVLPPEVESFFKEKVKAYLEDHGFSSGDIRAEFYSGGINKKALYVSHYAPGLMFECTENNDKGEFYFDVYELEAGNIAFDLNL